MDVMYTNNLTCFKNYTKVFRYLISYKYAILRPFFSKSVKNGKFLLTFHFQKVIGQKQLINVRSCN